MNNVEVSSVALEIAEMLSQIKNAERQKIVVQNKLDELAEQESSLREKLNKLDSQISSTKYAITHLVNENVKLSLVSGE
jgi:septation ring formation regulator EzrA